MVIVAAICKTIKTTRPCEHASLKCPHFVIELGEENGTALILLLLLLLMSIRVEVFANNIL
jgi:hypothetical protein